MHSLGHFSAVSIAAITGAGQGLNSCAHSRGEPAWSSLGFKLKRRSSLCRCVLSAAVLVAYVYAMSYRIRFIERVCELGPAADLLAEELYGTGKAGLEIDLRRPAQFDSRE